MNTNGDFLKIINLKQNKEELSVNILNNDSLGGLRGIILYSKINKYIIGSNWEYFSMIQYDSQIGFNDNTQFTDIIFPNPTTNKLLIKGNFSCDELKYMLININGQKITEANTQSVNNQIEIDFSLYPAGIYFLNLTCGKDILTYKIIKEK